LLWRGAAPGGAWVSSVFFGQAVVGKDLSDESGADLEAPLGEYLGDRIPIEIGLETRADDEGLNLLGAFRRRVWAWPFGEEVGWRSVEDGVADIVIGFARLEADAGGGQISIRNFCKNQEPSRGKNGQTNSAGFDGYKCRYCRELQCMERHWTVLAIIPYTSGKYQVPLERGAM